MLETLMKYLTGFALSFALLGTAACAQSAPSDKQIADFLMNNPETLRDALDNMDAWEEKQLIVRVKPQLFDNPNDATLGPKDAKVTIIEFFDYNCGYCKQSTQWVKDTLEKYPNDVRVIFKELPLLDTRTGTSRNAAKAALAAHRQGKYGPMHFALMAETNLSEERLKAHAIDIGLDIKQWESDIADDSIEDAIEEAYLVASQLPPLGGTPFFVIGEDYVAGANVAKLNELLNKAMSS